MHFIIEIPYFTPHHMFHKPSNIEVIDYDYILLFFMRAAKYYTIYIIQESCLQLLYYIYILYMRVGFNYSLVKYKPRPGVLDPRIETRSAQVPFYFETFIWTTLSRDSNADTKDNYFSTQTKVWAYCITIFDTSVNIGSFLVFKYFDADQFYRYFS